MANWNERRGHRGRTHEDAREDIHQGPWSPYNGRDHSEGDTWGARGREYWLEDDRWEDRRMGMGDQWRRREHDDVQQHDDSGSEWGNYMGLREEPSERGIPSSGPWQREPRYGEMERMWSDRDDHPWPNERRATDEERRRHQDYAHQDYGRQDYAHSRYAGRDRRDDYARERGGEQYPRQASRDESPRNWTDRPDRGEPWQLRHEQRLRAGRDQQRILDEERFGREEPEWMRRSYQRGPEDRSAYGRDDRGYGRDDRGDRGGYGRDDRGGYGRDDRGGYGRDARGDEMRRNEMRGGEMRRNEMRGGEMRGGEMRGGEMRRNEMRGGEMHGGEMHGRDERGARYEREMRGGEMHGREMHGREMHGRDERSARYEREMRDREMRRRDEMHGRDDTRGGDVDMRDRGTQRSDMRGHAPRGGETMDNREMRDREMHGAEMRDRSMREREVSDRDERDMHGRDMHGRDMQGRDGHRREELARGDRDDQGREQRGDDRSGAQFGEQRRDRNRYD